MTTNNQKVYFNTFNFENFAVNERDKVLGKRTFEWAEQHFTDMFE